MEDRTRASNWLPTSPVKDKCEGIAVEEIRTTGRTGHAAGRAFCAEGRKFLSIVRLLRVKLPESPAVVSQANAVIFVVPGRPTAGLTMIANSMGLSLLQHTLNKNYIFVHVPAIARPLIFLTAVVLVTAKLKGGIGQYSFTL